MQQSFESRLEALERLEQAQRPTLPLFVCMHVDDWSALEDPATPNRTRAAIAEAYGLGGPDQKLYVNICDGCELAEACRVCSDRPVVGA
jgi:hypothetical protein